MSNILFDGKITQIMGLVNSIGPLLSVVDTFKTAYVSADVSKAGNAKLGQNVSKVVTTILGNPEVVKAVNESLPYIKSAVEQFKSIKNKKSQPIQETTESTTEDASFNEILGE